MHKIQSLHMWVNFMFRVLEKEFVKAFKSNPCLPTKEITSTNKQARSNSSNEDDFPIRLEWTTIDQIIASRLRNLENYYFLSNLLI